MLDEKHGSQEILPVALVEKYLWIRERDIVESKVFYFQEIMPRLEESLNSDPEKQKLRAIEFDTLISLMGYSPETTVIAAAILRPKRLIVAYSADEKTRRAALPALNYLTAHGIIDQFSIEHVAIDAFDSDDIYGKLRARIPPDGKRVFDITGGTKVMSATGGSLAWELNLSLCYLNGTWDPRSGSSGLRNATRLQLVRNPSRQRGHEVRRAALRFYSEGNYPAAQEAFNASRALIDDSFLDHLAWRLCVCYQAMADFDRLRLQDNTAALRRDLEIGGFRMVAAPLEVESHVAALEKLAEGDRLTRSAAFLELAEGYRSQQRHDFSCLLAYRAMECIIEFGLQVVHPAFRMEAPKYDLLGDVDAIAKEFQGTPGYGSTLPPKLGLSDGFQLLCILADAHEHMPHPTSRRKACQKIAGYANLRNRSNLAHGYDTLNDDSSRVLVDGAEELAIAILRDDYAALQAARRSLRPRRLDELVKSQL